MKRQRVKNSSMDYGSSTTAIGTDIFDNDSEDDIPLQSRNPQNHRASNYLEAQIQEDDTLQAIALRFNCSVSELKRLNKIERDYEIHARKTLKIPIIPHSILLEHHLPTVHKSGHISPIANAQHTNSPSNNNVTLITDAVADLVKTTQPSINDIILNTKITRTRYEDQANDNEQCDYNSSFEEPLLTEEYDDSYLTRPRTIPIRKNDLSCNGSDCDISWICLLIFILALCFAIPLVYVLYLYEHQHDNHTELHHTDSELTQKLSSNIIDASKSSF